MTVPGFDIRMPCYRILRDRMAVRFPQQAVFSLINRGKTGSKATQPPSKRYWGNFARDETPTARVRPLLTGAEG